MPSSPSSPSPLDIRNVRLFIRFRVLFTARFYYPVITVLFLDFGLTLEQFALLNVAWAASIILLEVPSGALADIVGRRNLVVLASGLMVVEMSILCFAPVGPSQLLFMLFLVNRIISGAAEAAASGADEALAYDALAEEGDRAEWPRVLESQMRATSLAFVIASTVGAAVYDPELVQRIASAAGMDVNLTQESTLRFPLLLTLAMAVGAFFTALQMREVRPAGAPTLELCRENIVCALRDATRLTLRAGRWILQTPFPLVLLVAGVTLDSMIRLFLTMSSQYYRVIGLPEASFGLIGSAMGLLGLFVPSWSRRLAERRTPRWNAGLLVGLAWLGIWGLTFVHPWFGLLPVVLLFIAFFMLGFFMSHYLNLITESSQRATVLSFRGLMFNVGYGTIGILYALLLAWWRPEVQAALPESHADSVEHVLFVDTLQWYPWYFLLTLAAAAAFGAWRLRHSTDHRRIPHQEV
jgi:MFS family permease